MDRESKQKKKENNEGLPVYFYIVKYTATIINRHNSRIKGFKKEPG